MCEIPTIGGRDGALCGERATKARACASPEALPPFAPTKAIAAATAAQMARTANRPYQRTNFARESCGIFQSPCCRNVARDKKAGHIIEHFALHGLQDVPSCVGWMAERTRAFSGMRGDPRWCLLIVSRLLDDSPLMPRRERAATATSHLRQRNSHSLATAVVVLPHRPPRHCGRSRGATRVCRSQVRSIHIPARA